MFAPRTSVSPGGATLTKEQQLEIRLEGRRQGFVDESEGAIKAKRMKAVDEEDEFEAKGWRREWDKANATTMAAREVPEGSTP